MLFSNYPPLPFKSSPDPQFLHPCTECSSRRNHVDKPRARHHLRRFSPSPVSFEFRRCRPLVCKALIYPHHPISFTQAPPEPLLHRRPNLVVASFSPPVTSVILSLRVCHAEFTIASSFFCAAPPSLSCRRSSEPSVPKPTAVQAVNTAW